MADNNINENEQASLEPSTHESHEVNGFWWWLANNWKKVIFVYIGPAFTFLGGITYFEEIRDKTVLVWNMPEDGARAIAKSDSMHLVFRNEIDSLQSNVTYLTKENKILKRVLHHTTLGLSQETDPMQYKGIRFNATNPHYSTGLRTYWLFDDNKEYGLLIPYELKYNVQFDGYEYYDYVQNNKNIKLLPQ